MSPVATEIDLPGVGLAPPPATQSSTPGNYTTCADANLRNSVPLLLAYAISFVNVGLYWNNHHHLFHATDRIDGKVLWSNMFLLFWLSLVPFVIRWLDKSSFSAGATAAYGIVLGMAAIGYWMTVQTIIDCNGADSAVGRAIGSDRKGRISLALYAGAVPMAFVSRWIALALYLIVIAMWLVPDRRLTRQVED